MNKEELLEELSTKIRDGEISRDEIISYLKVDVTSNEHKETTWLSHFSVTKILYILGAAIVIVGIFIFISQIWNDIGSFGRIITTLGLGLSLAVTGSILLKQKPNDNIGAIFHFLGGMLIPGGTLVTLSELSPGSSSLWPVTAAFSIIFVFYLSINTVHKHPILTFFSIANGTAVAYALFGAVTAGTYIDKVSDLYAYLTMVVGVSYLLLAHSFRFGWNKLLLGALYFFGSLGLLGAGFTRVFDSGFWQLLYFFLVLGGLWLSVYMKSRSILVLSTIFLIAHIYYITSEYFADSLGWPISLVILGFVFIGLGYGSVSINQKYISSRD